MSPTNARSMAPTFIANFNPEAAPLAAASMTFTASPSCCSLSSSLDKSSLGTSVSGTMSFANISPPGAAMKEAAMRYSSGTPKDAYPAKTEPATEASPPTITANNSDCVMRLMKGRTTKGASVCPTKILAVAERLSALDVCSTLRNPPPKKLMTHCITPM